MRANFRSPLSLFNLSTPFLMAAVAFLATCSNDDITHQKNADGPGKSIGIAAAVGLDPVTGASITTNKDDYLPGDSVDVAGNGWAPNETVHFTLVRDPDVAGLGTVEWDVVAGEEGTFETAFLVTETDFGATFTLTATGSTSGSVATATFTDGIVPGDNNGGDDNGGGDDQLTLDAPSSSVGELLVAQVTVLGLAATDIICAPTGWTSVLRTNNGTTISQQIFYKVATAAEPGSYTFTFRQSNNCAGSATGNLGAAGGIIAYSGVDTSNPLDGTAAGNTATSMTETAPAITTAADLARIIRFFGRNNDVSFSGSPVYTADTGDDPDRSVAAYHSTQATAGPGTTSVQTTSNNLAWVAQTVGLRNAIATKLAFINTPFSGGIGSCLGGIVVQTQNAAGAVANVTGNTTVNLTSDGTGTFYSNASCTTVITSVSITTGNNTPVDGDGDVDPFYYRPTALGDGTHQLTAAATGLTSGMQTQTIIPATKLAFLNAPFSGGLGSCIGSASPGAADPGLVVQSQDATSTPRSVSVSATTVNLSTDGSGTFHTASDCSSSAITSVTIPAGGTDTPDFYYKVTAVGDGTHQITAAAAGLTSAIQPQTVAMYGVNVPASPILTVPAPAVAAGDVMIAQIAIMNLATDEEICEPAGWTPVLRTNNGGDLAQRIFYRVAPGAEAATTYSWNNENNLACTSTPENGDGIGRIVVYSGVDQANPIDVSGGSSGDGATSAVAPSVTTNAANPNARVLRFFVIDNDETITPPATALYNHVEDLDGGQDRSLGASHSIHATGGTAVGTATATLGDSEDWVAQTVVLRMAVANVATTTQVLASPTPSVFGQSVTFTATVTPTSGPAAAGIVTFYEFTAGQTCAALGGASTIGSDATAPFQFSTASLSRASHTISACYIPNTGWTGSNDDVVHDVNKTDVSVTVTDAPTASTFGQSVTFTAAVAAVAPGAGTPTGTVTFYEFTGGQTCLLPGAAVGSSDAAAPYEFTTSSLAVGPHTITACYGGDGNFNINSGTDAHTVSAIGTTTQVLAAPTPSVFGQSVTFTATVTPASGPAPTGTVNFYEFTAGQSCATPGVAVVLQADGVAPFEFSTSSLTRATHTISACYVPNAGWGASGDDVEHIVNKADVSVTVTDAPTASVFGQSVTFTAAVAAVGPGAGTPTGTVTFYELTGAQTCAAPGAALGSDAAAPYELMTSSLSVAAHTITACYGGDGNFNANSDSDTHTVSKADVTVTVTDAPTASVWGQSVTFTAALAATAPGAGTPTGTVTFYEFTGGETCALPGAVVGSGDGTAPYEFTPSPFAVGPHTITACYGGNGSFNESSGTDAHTVTRASTNVVVTSNTPTTFGNAANFLATVNVVAPGVGTPTGTVTFYEFGAGQSCAAPPASSLGSDATAPYEFSSNALGAGAHTISACYPGDGNFFADDGSMVHTVNAVTTTVVASTTAIPQYSDEINLKAVVTPVEVVTSGGTFPVTGNVRFYFNGAVSCPVADPGAAGAGVVGSDDIVDADNGVADDTDYQVLNAAGSYTLTACFYAGTTNFTNGSDTEGVTLTTEDATVTPDAGNINSIVSGAGGTPAASFTLTFVVKETNAEPDQNAGALAGALGGVGFGVTLYGIGVPGNTEAGSCGSGAVAGTGYNQTKTYTCTFYTVAVDAYEVVATVSGSYYDGGTYDAIAVYNPDAGFVTGGGKFIFPGTTDKVNFGLVYTNPSKKALRGNLVAIRHMANGDICRVKSNGMEAPAIVANAASFAGKGNYGCTRPDGTSYAGGGNLTITGWVQDNGQGSNATGPDKFWVKVTGALNNNLVMPGNSTNAAPLTGGNIQVPQPGR